MALPNLKLYLYNVVTFLFGILLTVIFSIFLLASIPVYMYRLLLLLFARKLFRTDLDSIVGGLSACFVDDFMTATVPRCNIVSALVFRGEFTANELKNLVNEKWILSNSTRLKKLQQQPVKWMGFYFWKSIKSSFSIDDYVFSLSGKDVSVDSDQLNATLEQLSNTKLPLNRSPWQMFVIENYRAKEICLKSSCRSTVMIFKFHHCLADGMAIKETFCGLFSDSSEYIMPPATLERNICKSIWYILLFPLQLIIQLPYFLAHTFKSSAYKLVNSKKERYQVYARTKPVSVQTIKNIKNAHGVSFASVLLSGISSAFSKHLTAKSLAKSDSGLCFTILPVPIFPRPKGLSNHVTGVLIDLHAPDNNLILPVERLRLMHQRLKNQAESYTAVGIFLFNTLVGWHLHYVSKYLKNLSVHSSVVTSLTGQLFTKLGYKNLELIEEHGAAGALPGNAGLIFVMLSLDQEVSVQVCVDRSVMVPEDTQKFVDYVYEEIKALEISITT